MEKQEEKEFRENVLRVMIKKFNPNDLGIKNSNLFGLPYSEKEVKFVIIPVPWEVTTSFRRGTAAGPKAILEASLQVDLYDPLIKDAWKLGLTMKPISQKWLRKNNLLRKKAEICIQQLEKGGKSGDLKLKKIYQEINKAGRELNDWVRVESLKLLKQKRGVGVLGGEHSVSLGLMQALSRFYKNYSVLYLDAHADLRPKYEGFEFSHASAFFNASKIKNIKNIVQVGIRDYCQEEADYIKKSKNRISLFSDRLLNEKLFDGTPWKKICKDIIQSLSKNVYISFDVDVLESCFCPNTGTPVPGGLSFDQALYLVETLTNSGRKIIGFDLCEISSPDINNWDANVGARLLWRIVNLTAKSQKKF